jgi:hypothetical protein
LTGRCDDGKLRIVTEEERRKRIQAILDKYDRAMALMRDARAASRRSVNAVERVDTSIGTSIDGLRIVLDALASANYANQSAHVNVVEGDDAVDRAIGLALEANHMAIALINEL